MPCLLDTNAWIHYLKHKDSGIADRLRGIAHSEVVTCSRNVKLVPDCSLTSVKGKTFDAIVLPGGGPGAKAMRESSEVGELLRSHKGIIGAVCAGPTVLKGHGIAKGSKLTSYPAFKAEFEADYVYDDESEVVEDGNLITSRGPGTSFKWAIKLVEKIKGAESAPPLAHQMILKA